MLLLLLLLYCLAEEDEKALSPEADMSNRGDALLASREDIAAAFDEEADISAPPRRVLSHPLEGSTT